MEKAGEVQIEPTGLAQRPLLVGVLLRQLRNGVNDGGIGRFWPTIGVEDQRMLALTPGAAVVQTPESDALDDVLVLLEDCEELCVVFSLPFQVFGRGRR